MTEFVYGQLIKFALEKDVDPDRGTQSPAT